MITSNMHKALNDQINAELWSAYLYLSMSLDAEAKSYKGIANWFYVQWLEEQDHARILQNYLNEQGAPVRLREIQDVKVEWNGPVEMFKEALEHERKVTGMIDELVRIAMKEQDFATMSRLQWFIDEQVEEERSASDVLFDLQLAHKDHRAVKTIDWLLGKREYSKAGPLK